MFLRAFYRGRPPSDLLRPLLLLSLAARWSTRHTDLGKRSPRLRRGREALVRRHFRTLLDEVSSPQWSWVGPEQGVASRSSRR
jgi:hypothetical protein